LGISEGITDCGQPNRASPVHEQTEKQVEPDARSVLLCVLTEPRDLQSVNLAFGDQRKPR